MKVRALCVAFFIVLLSGINVQTVKGTTPYTIMIYMNGSDLERKIGAATEDLIEMLESGLRSQNANVIILTGGSIYWQNDVVPSNECVLWYVADGELFEIERIGLKNMDDPDTLADFITFAMGHYPAQKYGLVMWDHGGGAISGFGHDEIFETKEPNNKSMTLLEMDYAFKKAGLGGQKLEWLGFDSCLMATIEMALISAQYAKYLIASEDLEPGDGWDYKFLGFLNRRPHASGYILGREIVDTFMNFYGPDSDEILTLSVTDLNKVQPVMDAMGNLMKKCLEKLTVGEYNQIQNLTSSTNAFTYLAKRRGLTKTFGEGSPRDNYNDMVDIGDMAHHLSDLFPHEARQVHIALNDAVLYNRYNSLTPLYGLSSYYVYGGLFRESLELYAELDVDEAYTEYLLNFFEKLYNRPLNRPSHLTTPLFKTIMGRDAYLYRNARLLGGTRYAAPASVNGQDCDVIVCFKSGEYEVLGYRAIGNATKQKGYEYFEDGDKVSFYYPDKEGSWQLGQEKIYDLSKKY